MSSTSSPKKLQNLPISYRSGYEYPIFAYQIRTPAASGSSGLWLIFRSNGSMRWNAFIRAFMKGAQAPGNSLCTTRRSEEHTSELQSRLHLVCRLLLEKKKIINTILMICVYFFILLIYSFQHLIIVRNI